MQTLEDATRSAHDRLVQETADRYSNKGYSVLIEPRMEALPEFLRGFQPDLIAQTPENENVFVIVGFNDSAKKTEQWAHLQAVIAAHSNWKLELVVKKWRGEASSNAAQPLLSEGEIEARIRAGQRLARQELYDSALLTVWAALEAILRRIIQTEKVELQNESPGALISTLTFEGLLDREDYKTLRDILPQRNQAAHGHRPDNPAEAVKQMMAIARRLLRERARLQAAA